jgi:hypothetical protein
VDTAVGKVCEIKGTSNMWCGLMRRQTLATFVTVSWLLTTVVDAAEPVITYDPQTGGVRLIQKDEVGRKVTSQFLVKAKGRREVSQVYGNVTGVLFQATAKATRPSDSPIKLTYRLSGDHDATLEVAFGQTQVTSDAPAWIWAVAARFADHDCTAAVTLRDEPPGAIESIFARRWKREHSGRLVWAQYHPAVDDTVVGFMLLAADAVMGDPVRLRTLTNGLVDFEKYSTHLAPQDQQKSHQAALALHAIIQTNSEPGDRVMLNDVDAAFRFHAVNGKLLVEGSPSYHFARELRQGVFQEAEQLNQLCEKNRHLLLDVNPIVTSTVQEFSRLVAFFNYVDETDPDELDEFVQSLQPVLARIPALRTPIAVPLTSRPSQP